MENFASSHIRSISRFCSCVMTALSVLRLMSSGLMVTRGAGVAVACWGTFVGCAGGSVTFIGGVVTLTSQSGS